MNRIASLVLLAVGVVLIINGFDATSSFTSDLSRFFTGAPTSKAVWMLVGGILAIIIALAGPFRGSKQR
jgi:hypothetical protein